jgi:hypothetical protein
LAQAANLSGLANVWVALRLKIEMAIEVDPHKELRQKILAESFENANTPGWGYFGMTSSLAIGDNSYAPRLMKAPAEPDDASAEPVRNIMVAPCKKGNGVDVYFRFETPLALGDPYIDRGSMVKTGKVQMLDPEAAFKPPGKIKVSANKLGYQYVPHCDTAKDPKEVREKYRDYVCPRQILPSYPKKGGPGTFGAGLWFGLDEKTFPESMADDYDAARKQRLKDLEEHKKLLQEAPFKGNDYGNKNFWSNIETYHSEIPTHIPRDPLPGQKGWKDFHEAPFKPSNPLKKGSQPSDVEWVPDPCQEKVRKPKDDNEKPGMKLGYPLKPCNPTPSVVTNTRNMRNERPASFMRPVL